MKTYRAKGGPFVETLYFEPGEIEQICLEELRISGFLPEVPSPIRIDRFLEKRFNVILAYDNLPENVLGYTRFGPNGVEEIVLSRNLSEEGTQVADRRLSATLAHEAGHALLHTVLFASVDPGPSLPLEGVDPVGRKILCRNDSVTGGKPHAEGIYAGGWWEMQANWAIGGFLLPKPLVEQALEPVLSTRGLLGKRILESERRQEAAMLLSEIFDVNPVVARIRLQGMYPEADEAQMTL